MPRFSIVIPAYNCEKTVGNTIRALLNQSLPREQYEIIIVDDGSLDNTREVIQSFPEVTYLWQNNKGPSSARNYGANNARGEVIVFTDSDCTPIHEWLEYMVRPFDNPEIAGVKGAYLTNQKELVARFCQKEFEERYRLLAKFEYIDFVDSYSAAFRKDAFLGVGGFDVAFPLANNEDVELSYKLATRGYKMVFVPQAVVYHTHASSWIQYLRVKFSRAYWRMLVYKKFPKKAMRDTYTPKNLKYQFFLTFFLMLTLMGLLIKGTVMAGLSFPGSQWIQSIWWGTASGIVVIMLMITTLPLSRRIYTEDREVGLMTPYLLIGRSAVFVTGTACGIIAFLTQHVRDISYPIAKRCFDIGISMLLLLFLAPVFVLMGLLIRLDSKGPVMFRHKRVGLKRKSFMFYKFRTMVKDAEDKKEELRQYSEKKGPVFKIKNDPRVTKVGRILRRFSLDELPQFFNVLRGDMSLVGPRPLPMIDITHPVLLHPKDTSIDPQRLLVWVEVRHSVLPGITGLWQIRGRSDLPLEAWFNFDLEYVKRRSFWMDLKIILRTIPVVILGKGAQ